MLSLALRHPSGDDPNYWMALTHQADAKNISKKVKKMLLDLNLASESGARVREGGGRCKRGVRLGEGGGRGGVREGGIAGRGLSVNQGRWL